MSRAKRQNTKFQGLQRFSVNVNNAAKKHQTMLCSQELTADGRRVIEKLVPVLPPPTLAKKSRVLCNIAESQDWDYRVDYRLGFGSFAVGGEFGLPPVLEQEAELGKKRHTDALHRPMRDWMVLALDYLMELMYHEGQGTSTTQLECHSCKKVGEDLLQCCVSYAPAASSESMKVVLLATSSNGTANFSKGQHYFIKVLSFSLDILLARSAQSFNNTGLDLLLWI
ncbi:hypothetical protein VNI00_017505 [Paramarasmius palmivorus]|uniref:Uncharacterized protein n=1 Tax=Paramarasmius palmivorus TaxID=297713 RepID=A0AAW0B681_9AGAR